MDVLYFLAWPKEALLSVSRGYIKDFSLECSPAVKEHLILHMGLVHGMAVEVEFENFVYYVPEGLDLEDYTRVISSFPTVDSPEILGLHPNAEVVY